jgi:hypothetical protein
MRSKQFNDAAANQLGIDIYRTDQSKLPESTEELELHMQLDYKQSVEIAEEEAINSIFDKNKYELISRRVNNDLTVIGIGAAKSSFNKAEGIKVEYVDPADLVYSNTDSPYFEDIYYVGEVKEVYLNELKKQFPELTDEQLESYKGYNSSYSNTAYNSKADEEIQQQYYTLSIKHTLIKFTKLKRLLQAAVKL